MSLPFTATRAILRKREGLEHPDGEIESLVSGLLDGSVADYQMTAWMMAVFFKGMTVGETTRLTRAMLGSGSELPSWGGGSRIVDKHSTGGVGDKISLIVAPIVAACGLRVPMISGRSLGHTGGTLDKLESIPGYTVHLEPARFMRIVDTVGCSIAGASQEIVPADRRMYALRDVAGIVESVPLIVSSILSKKAAAKLDGLVFDVKVGSGGFSSDRERARLLGQRLVETGTLLGMRCEALLTWMEEPLGAAAGNGLEAAESIRFLRGESVAGDLIEVTYEVAAAMLRVSGAEAEDDARLRVRDAVQSGRALERFEAMVRAQGGDTGVIDDPDVLSTAPIRLEVHSPEPGFVQGVRARAVGEIVVDLGGGRLKADDSVDPGVGVWFHARSGDPVEKGSILAEIHARDLSEARTAASRLLAAYEFGPAAPVRVPLVLETIVPDPSATAADESMRPSR
jgi:pyrimidine-nucleoside phosphorylase